ncbi:hypothetical protein G3480_05260 [Thiorhodococcus mannitoliphagus]|uniref:Uncharacterized protein n=1 Tax=Thiorhodococcus mannitoliphagus TaxID=329406 RepID=A0A6P1DP03_9GAMM|nr:hypothetical protein [Thiorhodococcus mannitoliphagus]NEX19728.1 hypothetical protein [Thiorhodococcus mannitoliphagus]
MADDGVAGDFSSQTPSLGVLGLEPLADIDELLRRELRGDILVIGGKPLSPDEERRLRDLTPGPNAVMAVHLKHAERLLDRGVLESVDWIFTYIHGYDTSVLSRLVFLAGFCQRHPGARLLLYLIRDFDPSHAWEPFCANVQRLLDFYALELPPLAIWSLDLERLTYRSLQDRHPALRCRADPQARMTSGLLLLETLIHKGFRPRISGFTLDGAVDGRQALWHDLRGESAWLAEAVASGHLRTL